MYVRQYGQYLDLETGGEGSAGGSGDVSTTPPGSSSPPGGDDGGGGERVSDIDGIAAAIRGTQQGADGGDGAGAAAATEKAALEAGKVQEVEAKSGERAAQEKDAQGRFKRPDPDFAPPPGLTPEGQQRFTKLVDRVRSAEGKAVKYDEFKPQYDAMHADVTELRQLLSDHRCEPEDLGQLLEFNKLRKSGDFEGMRKLIAPLLKEISLASGQSFEAEDPLADYPDLLQEVDDGYVTRPRALEIARSRARDSAQAEAAKRQQSQQGEQDGAKQAAESAIQSVTAWANELRANDIDFVAKEKMLMERIDGVMELYYKHPDLWLPTLKREYSLLKAGSTAGAGGAGSGGGSTNRPLRPSGSGAGMKHEPKSMFEAIKLQHTGGLVG